ncbi:MAG: NADH-quinone oxidoreductase subunit G [Rhodospirillales bacterium]|nr:NADH-quinone oxidoreductase subunit G [Rhodospirillales bacterium]MBO6786709.1 NADH-quinone oxidoreductase subunit G [Rhodospirillales bacterium]
MPKLTIDGNEVEVDAGLTVLQACEQAGIEIPRFCYHERLSIAGNCRMCLVALERAPKPVASCAMPVADGMVVHTNTPEVHKMRKGVMEFLLINHPLDCPICDQGGECDLQDQAMGYGLDHSRYKENKRAVEDKEMGPLIKTIMTRCIHCTRCVRFTTEIAGITDMGMLFRGEHAEITSYLEKAVDSELSGNVIDLCPVGALTSKPYAFVARPWELKKTETVDVMDALGSNIRVDARGSEVMRVLPRLNEDVNEEWISDKTRFACDGLRRQRLDRPYVRKGGKLQPATWDEAFAAIKDKVDGLSGSKLAAIAGDQADCEAMVSLKALMANLGSANIDCRQDGSKIDPSLRAGYIFNSTIAGIENADALLLVGTNPRVEAAVLNARIRKRFLAGTFPIGLVGEAADLRYDYTHLGTGPEDLQAVLDPGSEFGKVLQAANRPMIIVGQGALAREDGAAVQALTREIAEKYGMVDKASGWNGYNILHTAAARVGGLDLGFVPGEGGLATEDIVSACGKGDVQVLYLLGADEIDMNALGSAFVIYQGHHGDAGAHRADVILPGAAYTEKNATWVNTEGRVQLGRLAAFPPGDAREDWTIIRALSDVLGKSIEVGDLRAVRSKLVDANANFLGIDSITSATWGEFGTPGNVSAAPFTSPISNFYMTDPISRASETMAKCTETFLGSPEQKTGTDG